MRKSIPVLLAALLLGACNSYNLKYKADPQPSGANVFADFVILQDAIAIEVDTDGLRLEEIYVKKSDGTVVRPLNISYPSFGKSAAIGTGIGLGSALGSGGAVGVGTGIGIPVGPEQAHGLTTATFAAAALGDKPWEVHIKLQGVKEAVIPHLGGTPTAK